MKKIYIILLVLIAILVGLSLFLQKHTTSDKVLILKYKDNSKTIKFDTVEKMKHETISDLKDKKVSAVKLDAIIKLITTDDVTKVAFKSKDGASITLDKQDIPKAYLMREGNYYRLAIPSDEFGQRWLKYITVIIVE